MAIITHLEVGDKSWTPTDAELKLIVDNFINKKVPAVRGPVRINELSLLMPTRFVISAGTPEWAPTKEELDRLSAEFEAASKAERYAVVATRSGVRVLTTFFPEGGDDHLEPLEPFEGLNL